MQVSLPTRGERARLGRHGPVTRRSSSSSSSSNERCHPGALSSGSSVFYPGHGFLSIVASVRLLLGGRFNLESIAFASAVTVRQPPPPPSSQGKRPPGRDRVKPYGGRAEQCLERASWARDPLGPGGGSSRWAEVGGEWAGGLAVGRKMGRGNGCPVPVWLSCGPIVKIR